jgi:hypothetical protein
MESEKKGEHSPQPDRQEQTVVASGNGPLLKMIPEHERQEQTPGEPLEKKIGDVIVHGIAVAGTAKKSFNVFLQQSLLDKVLSAPRHCDAVPTGCYGYSQENSGMKTKLKNQVPAPLDREESSGNQRGQQDP